MARALWLPSVLRSAGLTVHEQPGWQTRGGDTFDPRGVIVHATAGRLSIQDDIRVLLTGSTSAPPPISQLFLARTGEWWVIASGRCNHALAGRAGNLAGLGNTNLLGIEAANDNRGEAWPDVQYQSYVRGVRAICGHKGWGTNRISGHKEHQPPPDKTDPTFSMAAFRAAVANPQEDDMAVDFSSENWPKNEHAWALSLRAEETVIAVRQIKADARAARLGVEALIALINAGGGSIDTAAVIAHMDALAAEEKARDEADREARRKAAQAAAIIHDADPANDPTV
jgi:hypothetical protein